jgi:hypothetical protein
LEDIEALSMIERWQEEGEVQMKDANPDGFEIPGLVAATTQGKVMLADAIDWIVI